MKFVLPHIEINCAWDSFRFEIIEFAYEANGLFRISGSVLGQRKLGRNIPVGADVKKSLNFDCPEEFGYYPHPADCTQYYVCVFGGALLESCTGGLMYSHELQTCDWPRNVGCDPTIEVTTPTVTYQSSSPNRSPEPKLRYTHPPPPPVPPQPAAVVTSRGQPRQLHHTQQEIVKQKQQQQLYVDAEEALPPAEEIESDRQQRVYRGQPSTIGQVQRDRDGLRQHTNAIPLSSGRGEKIGVISFGTQQSLPEYRIEKGNRPIEQTISTATPKTIYNNTNQYDSSRYDSYYALYDDDVDLYKDIEYAQHYHTEPPSPSPAPKQTYRGTPAPVTHQVIAQEKPSKLSNSAYIQNTYSTADDIYEPADIQRYNDNNYNSQDDHQPVYHQSKQTNRGDRNELNYIEEPATTKRITTTTTTTTVTTPRQYPTQKNVRIPSRYSNTANQNEVRVQPTHYTLPEDQESKTIPHIQNPTLLYVNVPDVPVLKPIVSQPSPFRFSEHSTTPKTPFFHYITKTSKSTSVVSTTPNPVSTAYIPVNKQSSKSNITNQKIIMPTTYSPPYFIRKSLLRIRTNLEGHDNSWKQVNKSVAPQLNVSESNENKAPLKLQIHPATINNELWSSTNIAIGDIEEEQGDESVTDSSSTIQYSRVNVASSTTESFKQFHLHSSTTTTMTAEPIQLVTDFNEISTSETFALDNDINNTSWLLLLERLNSISHDNKTTSPEMEHDSNQSNFSLTEKQISVTFNPIEDVTKKTFSRTTPIPTRASRVNAAIKSVITFGGPQRQYSKCSDNKTSTAKCGKINQRVTTTNNNNNRGRGSAHYTSSGRNNENNLVNRGTPASRSRPTLKPSTSVIAKAAEFVDIYKYPPRRPDSIYPQPLPDKTAAKCRKDVCLLPDCSCGGKEIPGDLPVEQVPQMVLLTYDDSVNDLNKGLYHDLFEKGRVNPNGCPIAATFYVSHEWTDYSQVQNLYSDGHELASHTVSHSFGEQFSQKKWTKEVAGQREILSAYGGVHLEDVRGMRAPFLSVGGNKMFKMLYDSNFTYDSSMPIYENKPPSWPYTLDYKLFHDCMIPPCPTRSYPGVWEVPMVMWQDLNGGRCSMGDACSNPSDAEGVYKMIMKNFERHYTSNRAPFGLFYHAAWFTQPHHKEGFIQFLDAINSMKDVWLVTNWQAIQWVRDPTPVSRLNSFQPFGCNYPDRPKRCNNPKVCNLWHKTGVRYMRTCQPCPDIYPWTGNTGIHSSRIDNDLEE
ncbi:hypothetical protein FQR65_LT14833 [Abscondita terminalis]|nr:hypothetical protein FQR65_LT14833 [Abscondita terminalis]